jgi:hypothetical protein
VTGDIPRESAHAARMVGLPHGARCDVGTHKSGAKFRTIVHEGGTIERWQQPKLPAWEMPRRNPDERRPRAPDYWGPKTAAENAKLSAARDDAADDDIAA